MFNKNVFLWMNNGMLKLAVFGLIKPIKSVNMWELFN